MNQQERAKRMQQIITKSWSGGAFKQKLLADALAVLKEEGLEIPEGIEARVAENTDGIGYSLIPRSHRRAHSGTRSWSGLRQDVAVAAMYV